MHSGRFKLPAEFRKCRHISTEQTFETEVVDSAIVLHPAEVISKADSWAYTPEHRELLARAHADSREGRVYQLSEEQLAKLGEEPQQ